MENRQYLNNKELYIEIIISKARGKLTRNAERMLELLAKKTIKKMRYWSNDDRLDCYQSGLLDMFQNWYNFNEDKSINAFAYFTEIFKRGLAKGWNDLYKKKGDNDGGSSEDDGDDKNYDVLFISYPFFVYVCEKKGPPSSHKDECVLNVRIHSLMQWDDD